MSAPANDGGWLAIDELPRAELPQWARPPADREYASVLSEHGLAYVTRDVGSVASFEDVLGVALVPASADWLPQAYVLVPRRPPRPPWFAIGPGLVPAELADRSLESFARTVRERAQSAGYRQAWVARDRVPIDELRTRVLGREPIPGAVEVPIGSPPVRHGSGWKRPAGMVGAMVGFGGYAGFMGWAVGLSLLGHAFVGPAVIVPSLVVGGVAAALGTPLPLLAGFSKFAKSKQRILVLAPDGCVLGADDGVHALGWSDVVRFAIGELKGAPCLSVEIREPARPVRVSARFFSVPLEVVVAIAEALRKRADSST